jgi:hypothetical protein
LEDKSPTSCVLVLLVASDVAIVVAELVLTSSPSPLGMPLPPSLLYPREVRLHGW